MHLDGPRPDDTAAGDDGRGFYRALFEDSPRGVFVTDRAGRCLEVNEAACRLTGYTRDQLLALHRVEEFGWQVAFVRRPLFQSPLTVVSSPEHQRFAVLEDDGEVNMRPDIVIRH